MSDFIKNIFYKQREDFKETSHKRHEEMTFPDDVFEVDVEEDVYAGVGHIFAPQEFAEWGARAPQNDFVVVDAVELEGFEDALVGVGSVDVAEASAHGRSVRVRRAAELFAFVNREIRVAAHDRPHFDRAVFPLAVFVLDLHRPSAVCRVSSPYCKSVYGSHHAFPLILSHSYLSPLRGYAAPLGFYFIEKQCLYRE